MTLPLSKQLHNLPVSIDCPFRAVCDSGDARVTAGAKGVIRERLAKHPSFQLQDGTFFKIFSHRKSQDCAEQGICDGLSNA